LRDTFGDPFGILLISLPPGAVEPGKPATIRVEGKPAPNKEGSFVIVAQVQGAARYVEKHGGVTKLASNKGQVQDRPGEKPRAADKPPGPAVAPQPSTDRPQRTPSHEIRVVDGQPTLVRVGFLGCR